MSDTASDSIVLGRYRIVRRLTQGGMGVVYLGRVEGAAGFAKAVVIKRILSGVDHLEQNIAQFIREAQILSHLQHPGIVGVLDFGHAHDGYAMVLEYVHGYDLARWLKYLRVTSCRMHWEEAVFITLRVLEALHYAHTFESSDGGAACVLHRDISPGNILLDLEGRVRLLDFGIARMVHGDTDECKTETGVLKGKVGYLAPEIFSLAPATTLSDLYSCGVVLYQMLAGAHPFASEDQRQTMFRAMQEPPSSLIALRDDMPRELEAVVFQALAKDPTQRHPSAEAFCQALRATLSRSEADIFVALRERLRDDFTLKMPAALHLEPLQEREKAWREAQRASPREPAQLRSSMIPASAHDPPSSSAEVEPTVTHEAQAPAARMRLLSSAGIGAVVAAALLSALFLALRQPPVSSSDRFIVVGTPAPPREALEPVRATAPEPAAPPPAGPVANRPGAASAKPVRRAEPARDASPSALTEPFARRQPALEACFARFASELQGRPEISVTFAVQTSGHVSSATLSPQVMSGTPLGKCLLSVARGTNFGPQARPVRFSIPLIARAVSSTTAR